MPNPQELIFETINSHVEAYCRQNNVGTENKPLSLHVYKQLVEEAIVIYNNTPQADLGGKSPNQAYCQEGVNG